jgi:hypothetical protein
MQNCGQGGVGSDTAIRGTVGSGGQGIRITTGGGDLQHGHDVGVAVVLKRAQKIKEFMVRKPPGF